MTKTIDQIVLDIIETHENGKPDTYGTIVCIPGDTGGLSGGLLMASMSSGNLGRLLRRYRDLGGQRISEEEVRQTEAKDPSQNSDPTIRKMFRDAATDPIMVQAQEEFFTQQFLVPAKQWCAGRGFQFPLSLAVVADSIVHGAFYGAKGLAAKIPATLPEQDWIKQYVAARRLWLSGNKNPVLQKCVYRMKTFDDLISANNWSLTPPFTVHGFKLEG